jgi:diacylglycerol kinase family enzyme
MRATLIHNPTAGKGDAKRAALLKRLRAAGYEPTYQSIKDDDWESALEHPADLVIAAGGDGTVAKVAEKLRGKTAVLAILPLGSANNIATGLGIRGKAHQVIAKWKTYAPRRFDFWRCVGPWGKQLIIEGCGLGAITEVGARLDAADTDGLAPKEKLALSRRLIRGLVRDAKPFKLKAECDGKPVNGRFLLFEVMNLSAAGPRLRLVREADPFDGLLDVVFVRPRERDAFLRWLRRGARDSWVERPSLRCKRLRLESKNARLRLADNLFWPPKNGGKAKKNGRLRAEIKRQRRTVTVLAPRRAAS